MSRMQNAFCHPERLILVKFYNSHAAPYKVHIIFCYYAGVKYSVYLWD